MLFNLITFYSEAWLGLVCLASLTECITAPRQTTQTNPMTTNSQVVMLDDGGSENDNQTEK